MQWLDILKVALPLLASIIGRCLRRYARRELARIEAEDSACSPSSAPSWSQPDTSVPVQPLADAPPPPPTDEPSL